MLLTYWNLFAHGICNYIFRFLTNQCFWHFYETVPTRRLRFANSTTRWSYRTCPTSSLRPVSCSSSDWPAALGSSCWWRCISVPTLSSVPRGHPASRRSPTAATTATILSKAHFPFGLISLEDGYAVTYCNICLRLNRGLVRMEEFSNLLFMILYSLI